MWNSAIENIALTFTSQERLEKLDSWLLSDDWEFRSGNYDVSLASDDELCARYLG